MEAGDGTVFQQVRRGGFVLGSHGRDDTSTEEALQQTIGAGGIPPRQECLF